MKVKVDWDKLREKPPYSCGKCRKHAKHSEKYDAYFCGPCNRWTEKKCGDKTCEYCAARPTKPINKVSSA